MYVCAEKKRRKTHTYKGREGLKNRTSEGAATSRESDAVLATTPNVLGEKTRVPSDDDPHGTIKYDTQVSVLGRAQTRFVLTYSYQVFIGERLVAQGGR